MQVDAWAAVLGQDVQPGGSLCFSIVWRENKILLRSALLTVCRTICADVSVRTYQSRLWCLR